MADNRYKFFRVSRLTYDSVVDIAKTFFKSNAFSSYQDALNEFYKLKLVYGDSFLHSMRRLGCEVVECFYDCPELQSLWSIDYTPHLCGLSDKQILYNQIKQCKPEILYFQHSTYPFSSAEISEIKCSIKSIRLVVVHNGFKLKPQEIAPIDLLLAASPDLYSYYLSLGSKTTLVYHYFDEYLLLELMKDPAYSLKDIPVSFVGSSGFGLGKGHVSRYWLLYTLLNKTNINMYLDEESISKSPISKLLHQIQSLEDGPRVDPSFDPFALSRALLTKQVSDPRFVPSAPCTAFNFPTIPLHTAYPDRVHSCAHGVDYFKLLHRSKISVHRHTDVVNGYAAALRVFQATGCGSCLITDGHKNIADLFLPDKEVLVYQSPDQCVDLINYCIDNPEITSSISKSAQQRCLSDHSSYVRCSEIISAVEAVL